VKINREHSKSEMKEYLNSISMYLIIPMMKPDHKSKSRIRKKWKKGCNYNRQMINRKGKQHQINRNKQLEKGKIIKDRINNN
jgi:hypothetical protein